MSRYELIRPERPSLVQRFIRSIFLGPYSSKDKELARIFGGGSTATGISVTEHTALNLSSVWAAINLISGDVATLPLCLFRRKDGNAERYEAHPLYRLLHDAPNPETTSITFRRTLQAHALSWGNGYAEIERDRGDRPIALWQITPDRVTVEREAGQIRYRVTNAGKPDVSLAPFRMLHIPGMGYDGLQGYPVIRMARDAIGLGMAAERFGAKFFGNGASFGGVFEHPKTMSETAQANFEKKVNAGHQGVDRAHRFIIAEEGMKYVRLGIPPDDAQFLETRQFQVTDIARWFNVPPHKIGDLSRATFSNIEQQNIEYLQTTLIHWLETWEQELTMKLISPLERNQQFIEHVTEGFLRGDSAGRAQLQSSEFNIGAGTPNEIRALSNRNPVAGGDIAFVPLNMMPLSKVEAYWDAQIAKLKEPSPAPAPPSSTMEMEDEPDPDMESMRARLEQLVADNTEKDIARRQAEQRADDLSAAQTQAEAERDAARADHTHTLELLAGAETALAAEQAEHAIARDKAASDSAAATARYGDLESRYTATLDDYAGEVHRADNLLRKLNAANEELERERAEHADTRANYIKDIEAAAAKTADVDRQRDAEVALRVEAKNTQRQAEAAREAAIQRAEAAERDKGIAEQAQQAANQLIEERRQVERARMVGVIAAHRALIADVMSRMVQRETEKARRNQATPEKLRKWAESFYSLHEQTCVEALIPAVRAHLAWLQRFDDSEAVARTLVRAHIRESVTQLRAVADADPDEYHGLLERTLTRWETERPHALADAVQKEAISYVAGD